MKLGVGGRRRGAVVEGGALSKKCRRQRPVRLPACVFFYILFFILLSLYPPFKSFLRSIPFLFLLLGGARRPPRLYQHGSNKNCKYIWICPPSSCLRKSFSLIIVVTIMREKLRRRPNPPVCPPPLPPRTPQPRRRPSSLPLLKEVSEIVALSAGEGALPTPTAKEEEPG